MSRTPAAARWSQIIDRQEASGQTARAFAQANGLNPNTLASWRSQLGRTRRRKPTLPPFVELRVCEPAPKEPAPLNLLVDALGVRVLVAPNTDLQRLRQVLEALC